jgi:putative acetyltransferase
MSSEFPVDSSAEQSFINRAEQTAESMDRLKNVVFRAETPKDSVNVGAVLDEAFGAEKHVAEMVRLIRESPNYAPQYSVVAEKESKIVGYVMLSRVELEDGNNLHQALTLSPLAVTPSEQGSGIGGRLIREVAQAADNAGEQLIVLEGSPDYYPRFGFRPAGDIGISIDLPSWAPPEAAMAMPLKNYNPKLKGKLKYPPAFDVIHD